MSNRIAAILTLTLLCIFVGCFVCCSDGCQNRTDKGQPQNDALFPVRVDGRYGFIDNQGVVQIPLRFRTASDFFEGMALVKCGRYSAYLDFEGKLAVGPLDFEELSDFRNGYAIVKDRHSTKTISKWYPQISWTQWCRECPIDAEDDIQRSYLATGSLMSGLIDKQGKLVFPVEYDFISPVAEGRVFTGKKDSEGVWHGRLIDIATMKTIREFPDAVIGLFSEGLAPICISESPSSKWILDFRTSPEMGLLVCIDGKIGFIDRSGEIVIEPKYDITLPFTHGKALTRKWGWHFIDKSGKEGFYVERGNHSGYPAFSEEGLAQQGVRIQKEGYVDIKLGYVDQNGAQVIPAVFDIATPFSEELAAVRKQKWGYIDKTGKEVIKFQFDRAYPFHNGLARVDEGDKFGYIDKTGKWIWKPTK